MALAVALAPPKLLLKAVMEPETPAVSKVMLCREEEGAEVTVVVTGFETVLVVVVVSCAKASGRRRVVRSVNVCIV